MRPSPSAEASYEESGTRERSLQDRGLPVPWGLLGGTLVFATAVQVGCVTVGYTPMYYGLGSDDVGRWSPFLPLTAEYWFRQEGEVTVFLGQLLANGLGWLAAVTLGRGPRARPWVRRGFLGLAVLGLLAGGAHLSLDFVGAGLGELASAAGALTAVWLLKSR